MILWMRSTQKLKHCTGLPASSLPKVNKKGQRSLYIHSAYTQNAYKAGKMNHLTKVIQSQGSNSQINFFIKYK